MRMILGVGLLAATIVSASGQDAPKSAADVVAAVMPSVVMIQSRGARPENPDLVADDLGSGFIVDPSGIIVTNRHVIDGAFSVAIDLADGTHLPAKLIGRGTNFDIAVLKVDAGRPLPAVKLGDSDKVRVGDQVIAIGNPLGFARTVSSGVVSALHRNIGVSAYDDLIQTDAAINHGNSGGPLFNMAGEVIGINQAIHTENGGGSIGISFSIPINEARAVLKDARNGKPSIGWFGIGGTTLTAAMRKAIGLSGTGGVMIASIAPKSPAEAAKLQIGDIIEAIGDRTITDSSSLNRAVAQAPDKTLDVKIIRQGTSLSVPVKFGTLTEGLWVTELPQPKPVKTLADLGLTLANSNNSVVATGVVERSVAWAAGVRPGDTIRKIQFQDVHSIDDVRKAVEDLVAKGLTDGIVLVSNKNGSQWVNISMREW